MAEPTEADRSRAKAVVGDAHSGWCAAYDPTSPYPCHCRLAGIADAIAQALADERERARAPFLAALDGPAWALAAAIRRAAEETGQ